MKTTLTYTSFLMTLVALTAVASAQGVALPNLGYAGYFGHHASTFEEGVLQGAAALTAASGQRNYLNSAAAIICMPLARPLRPGPNSRDLQGCWLAQKRKRDHRLRLIRNPGP